MLDWILSRNDATVPGDRHSLREAWRYRPARGSKFSAWICDETLSTFLLGKDIERPAAEDICHVKVLEQEDKSAQTLSRPQQSSQVSCCEMVESHEALRALHDIMKLCLHAEMVNILHWNMLFAIANCCLKAIVALPLHSCHSQPSRGQALYWGIGLGR